MNSTIFRKIVPTALFCVVAVSFLFYLPAAGFGQEVCPLPLRVEVSPYQVNIDAGGAAHYVRVLTYTSYSNTAEAFVYINENDAPIDSTYIILTRDSVGRLVVKIDLDALQAAELEAEAIHYIKIVVILKMSTDECSEKEGVGEIYITGKKGV